jgi:hypothetical protein
MNELTSSVRKRQLTTLLIAHSLNVSSDRPVFCNDDSFLGHWQDEAWIERLREIARELADLEKKMWLQSAVDFVNSDLGETEAIPPAESGLSL